MATPTTSQERIPCFTIDLAKPPRERYDEVVQVLGPRMRSLTGLFDDLLSMFITSAWLSSLVRRLSKVCLYRVYDEEENEEIKGISARSGVPLYLLVALNNLLDCLLGCTSGAVSVSPSKTSRKHGDRAGRDHTRLMHFRTLDWGMDELRDLLVVLEFVDSSSGNARQIIARSITYAGFVGSLTAISQGMSISLNHRPNHDCPSRQLRWHQLLVLLGKRRSIGSIVRSFMLRPVQHGGEAERPVVSDGAKSVKDSATRFVEQAKVLTLIPSAPCYLVLCNGQEVALIVKDYVTGTVQTSREFIAQTNHDPKDQRESRVRNETSPSDRREVITSSFGIEGWLEESIDRLQCIQKKWDRLAQKSRRKPASTTASAKTGEVVESQREILSVTETTLRRWMSDYPTLNECSHFTALLDPASGEIRWLMRGLVEGSSEEHQVQN